MYMCTGNQRCFSILYIVSCTDKYIFKFIFSFLLERGKWREGDRHPHTHPHTHTGRERDNKYSRMLVHFPNGSNTLD